MVANCVAFIYNALVDARKPFYPIADAKKACLGAMSGKHV
jgi:hypothetical protein